MNPTEPDPLCLWCGTAIFEINSPLSVLRWKARHGDFHCPENNEDGRHEPASQSAPKGVDLSEWRVTAGWDQVISLDCARCIHGTKDFDDHEGWPSLADLVAHAEAHVCRVAKANYSEVNSDD